MKQVSMLFLFWGSFCFLQAQSQLVKQWDKRYGGSETDNLNALIATTDRGYLLGGHTYSDTSGDCSEPTRYGADFWMVKVDSFGIKQWDKRFGGSDADVTGAFGAIKQTKDGGYILGGVSRSGISGDKTQASRGITDFWVVKTDSAGNKIWDKRFGGDRDEDVTTIIQTKDGGYILGGSSESGISGDKTEDSRGWWDFWIVKIDSAGNKLWDKRFGSGAQEFMRAVQQTPDGGYILGGDCYSNAYYDVTQPSRGASDFWIVKIDSTGTKQWDRRFGGADYEMLSSLIITADGGYYLAGTSGSGMNGDKTQASWGLNDYWVVKTDSLGNKLWDQRYGSTNIEDYLGNAFQTFDGGFLLCGTSYSPIGGDKTEANLGQEQTWIIKTDANGFKQWDKTIFTSGHDENSYAVQCLDGCYAFSNITPADTGGYKTEFTRGMRDYWVVKFCDTTLPRQVPLHTSVVGYNASCPSACNGSAVINPLNGTSPYTYLWQPGNYNTAAINNLCAGTYNVTVTDVANNSITASITIAHPNAITPNDSSVSATCGNSNGSASVTPTGGNGSYTYLWSTGGTAATISNLAPANYTVTVTSGVCSVTTATVVNATGTAVTLFSSTVATSCNSSNGSASVAVTTGASPYSYLWSNGRTIATISNVTSGTYTVTVTGFDGCTTSTNVTVAASTGVTLLVLPAHTSCGNSNGSVSIIPTTGVSPFVYLWSNGDSVSTPGNLAAGTYTVTTTDVRGCSATAAVTINSSNSPHVTAGADKYIMCTNDSALICATGSQLTYLWNTGQSGSCIHTQSAGNYYVTATDNNNCTVESNHLSIAVYPSPSVSISVNGDTLAAYNAITYQWYLNGNKITGATGNIYIADQTGTYSVAVTDTNGCIAFSNTINITGIHNLYLDKIIVHPNPATDQLFIETNEIIVTEINIYSVTGSLVNKNAQLQNGSVDISQLAKGAYIVEIKSNELSVNRRWVKM